MEQVRTNVNKTTFDNSCLLKYTVQPFNGPEVQQWHQNLWQVPMLATMLGCYGYNVDVINWNATEIELHKQYDLLVDISPHNRELYQQYLTPNCPQILYATGSYPLWQRSREEERLEDLYQRRGIRLAPKTPLFCSYPHPDAFNAFLLVGNKHTLNTFGSVTTTPTFFIKNTGYVLAPKTNFSQKSPQDFLFFASQPQVLKGLDLLLEAFAACPEANLYVCSLFQQEPDFCKAYEAELFHYPNIKSIGFVDFQGEIFQEIISRCSYVILPSCSEGISGSVLTAMSAGLIPIVSESCGMEKEEAHILTDCSIDCIKDTVRYFSSVPAEWLRAQSYRSMAIIEQRYNPRHYIQSVQSALTDILGTPRGKYSSFHSHLAQQRSACMITNTRVAIPLTGGNQWHGGVSYVEALVKSLSVLSKTERPHLYLVVTEKSLSNFDCYRPFISFFDDIIFLGPSDATLEITLGLAPIFCHSWDELFSLVDFYYPVNSDVLPYRQAVSWIPDFQHRYLPEFFSSYEYQLRESQFAKIAAEASLVILNSRDAEADFKKYYPKSQAITKVLSACPYPEETWYCGEPEEIRQKYQLPNQFILCSNQFWVHKNHITLFQAISILQKEGHRIHLVCTGPTEDYRAPDYFDTLQGQIDALGIRENVSILGLIPREDQLQLLRCSLFVVQPSLFEGLSLVVQECRALGKPIVISDLSIHREYSYGTFFKRKDPHDLAQKMALMLSSCQLGPDREAEAKAKETALLIIERRAREFCDIVLEHLGCPMPQALEKQAEASVTIVTSLSCDNIINQQAAIASWRQCGFQVVALNTAEDITALTCHFPDMEFVSVHRDGRCVYGKSYIFLRDILDYCACQQTAICGIVKSDIMFRGSGLANFFAEKASGSIVFGSHLDVAASDSCEGTPHIGGFDFIFFDKKITEYYPDENFCLGLAWWDYWLILMAIANDVPGKLLTSPVAYHVIHSEVQDIELWQRLGMLLAHYAETDFNVTAETMADYQHLLYYTIRDNSIPVQIN